MNAQEDHGFDVYGYLHLSQVLTPAEVETCIQAFEAVGSNGNSPVAPIEALLQHPVLTDDLESLCGTGFVEDKPPRHVAVRPGRATGWRWSNDPENPANVKVSKA